MALMDATIVNVALPTLGRQFQTSSDAVDGVVIAYLVSLAVFIPTSGWLGDKLGGRRVLLGSIVVFAGSSALCGLATSLGELVLCRIIQGVGGGLMTPVGMAMLWRVFPPAERARASAILMIPTALAPAVGPVLGGLLVTDVSWRWIFYVNVPMGLLALAFGLMFLTDQRLDRAGSFDLPGFVLAGAGLGLLMYGVSEGPINGWGDTGILATVAAGAVLIAAFIVVELGRAEPLLDLRLLRDRLFTLSHGVMFLASVGFIGTIYLIALFYQDGLGMTALQSGLSTIPEALGVMVGAQFTVKRRYPVFGPRMLIVGGLLVAAAGMVALLSIGPSTSLWWARLILLVIGFGISGVFVPTQTAAFATTSKQKMGGASTLFNTGRQFGGAVGVAVLTSVLVAVGPLTHTAGRLVPDLTAYRVAFLVSAAFMLLAAVLASLINDADAAPTITRWRHAPTPAASGRTSSAAVAAGSPPAPGGPDPVAKPARASVATELR